MSCPAWIVLQTNYQQEQVAKTLLSEKGYTVFLPTYSAPSRASHAKERQKPLFPGYLFCRLEPTAEGRIITTPCIRKILSFGKTAATVPEDEMAALGRIASQRNACQPWRFISTGALVQIRSGPLMGLEGVLVSSGNSRKLVVSVQILQRSAAVTLEENTELRILGRLARGTLPYEFRP